MPYTVLSINAKTGVISEELPWETIAFTSVLNDKGTWNVSLPLSFLDKGGYEKLSPNAFDVANTIVAIVKDGVILYGGLIMAEQASVGEEDRLVIGGPDCAVGYLDSRELRVNQTITGLNQLTLASNLIALANTNGIFGGITAVTEFVGTVPTRDRTWYAADSPNLGKLVRDLSGLIDGFDFASEFTGTQGTGFQWKIRLGYPELRRTTGNVLSLDKNMSILSYSISGPVVNSFVAKGSESGKLGMYSVHTDAASLLARPQYDGSASYGSVTVQSTLDQKAQQGTKIYGAPAVRFNVKLNPEDPDCQVGSFRPGDQFRVVAKRGRINVDDYFRVVSYTVSVDGNGTEQLEAALVRSDTFS